MGAVKVFKYECPECPKKITSLFEGQFNFNVKEHKKKHEKEKRK